MLGIVGVYWFGSLMDVQPQNATGETHSGAVTAKDASLEAIPMRCRNDDDGEIGKAISIYRHCKT